MKDLVRNLLEEESLALKLTSCVTSSESLGFSESPSCIRKRAVTTVVRPEFTRKNSVCKKMPYESKSNIPTLDSIMARLYSMCFLSLTSELPRGSRSGRRPREGKMRSRSVNPPALSAASPGSPRRPPREQQGNG